MSNLLESIARRRRATAAKRLGPPTGGDYPAFDYRAAEIVGYGGSTATLEPEAPTPPEEIEDQLTVEFVAVEPEPEAIEPDPEPEAIEPEPEPEATEPEATEPEATEPEPEPQPEPEPTEPPTIPEPDATAAEPSPQPAPVPDAPVTERLTLPRFESWVPPPGLLSNTPTQPAPVFPTMPIGSAELIAPHAMPSREAVPQTPSTVIAPLPVPAAPAPRRLTLPAILFRARVRRRIRYLRQLREIQLRDIGGFALELHRYGSERPEVVAAKLETAAQTDHELRQLELILHGKIELRELREAGIGGACATCGAVFGSQDRFCASCGEPVKDRADADGPLS